MHFTLLWYLSQFSELHIQSAWLIQSIWVGEMCFGSRFWLYKIILPYPQHKINTFLLICLTGSWLTQRYRRMRRVAQGRGEDSDIEEMGKNIEVMLTSNKTSSQVSVYLTRSTRAGFRRGQSGQLPQGPPQKGGPTNFDHTLWKALCIMIY